MPKHLALARSLLLLLPPLPPFYNSMVLYNGSPAVPLRVKCLWCNYVFPSTASRGYPSPAGFICKPVHYVFREVRLRRQNNSHNSLCVFFLPLFNVVFFWKICFILNLWKLVSLVSMGLTFMPHGPPPLNFVSKLS